MKLKFLLKSFFAFKLLAVLTSTIFIIAPHAEEPADTSLIPVESEYKTQMDETKSTIKETAKNLNQKLNALLDKLEGKKDTLPTSPEALQQKIRIEFQKLTKDQVAPTLKAWELLRDFDDTNMVLIDVRQPEEQVISMIPGALTPGQFAANYNRPHLLKNKRIITYCTIGYRSGIFAEQLLIKGLDVKNLEGGLLSWSHLGGRLICPNDSSGEIETKKIHVYSEEWNFLHPDYQGVW
ncbi:MAG: rhodanese-like domain-containing protein [Fibrobacteria bacterium]|nr:rhodanese-like domain-containing protein [Fibrobacteria bacterium]